MFPQLSGTIAIIIDKSKEKRNAEELENWSCRACMRRDWIHRDAQTPAQIDT